MDIITIPMDHRTCARCGNVETCNCTMENAVMWCFECKRKESRRIIRNANRRKKHVALTSLGLKRVNGALGGAYYE